MFLAHVKFERDVAPALPERPIRGVDRATPVAGASACWLICAASASGHPARVVIVAAVMTASAICTAFPRPLVTETHKICPFGDSLQEELCHLINGVGIGPLAQLPFRELNGISVFRRAPRRSRAALSVHIFCLRALPNRTPPGDADPISAERCSRGSARSGLGGETWG